MASSKYRSISDGVVVCDPLATTWTVPPRRCGAGNDLYGDKSCYLAAYADSLDATVASGFLLESDRVALLARAQGVAFGS
jgi:hypothetical protein